MRRAFLGVFSSRECLHTGFWAKGRHHRPRSVKNDQLLSHWGSRTGAFSAVLHPRPRARGPRDAEYSGICTPPPGVPVGKKQPPRRNIHSTGQFMQYSACGCACRSAFLPTDATSCVALNVFGETIKVVERDHVIGKQAGNLIMHGAAANIVC